MCFEFGNAFPFAGGIGLFICLFFMIICCIACFFFARFCFPLSRRRGEGAWFCGGRPDERTTDNETAEEIAKLRKEIQELKNKSEKEQ